MRKSLGEILINNGSITEKELNESLKTQQKNQLPLGQIIQKKGFAGEVDIMRALAELHNIDFIEKIDFSGYEEI